MSPVSIPCPKCDAALKLPTRKLLGRKGKCPKCQHRFIMEEPDEVELELAFPEEPATPRPAAPPMKGTSAKWVPDASTDIPVLPSAPVAAAAETNGVPAAPNFDFASSAPAAGVMPATDSVGNTTNELDFAGPAEGEGASITSRVRSRRKRKNRKGPIAIGVGTGLFVFCALGLWWQQSGQSDESVKEVKQPIKPNEEWEKEKKERAESNENAKQLSPTSGENIPMQFMPFTPHLICHLRPSDIWAPERRNQEFVATLGDLGTWLKVQIGEVTRFEPQEIEELTFALNFGPRTSPPDVAAVVRLKTEQSISDLHLNRFEGKVRPDLVDAKIYEAEFYSYLIIDRKTFVVAPNTMSDMLAEAKKYARQPSVELEGLLKESDRQRHATLMFDVTNIDTHREYIFQEEMQTFADEFVLWFGKDVQTVSWSMHFADELFMETLLHENNESSPMRVLRHMNIRLQELPQRMQHAARFMKPGSVGYRDMIGRFPSMLKATALGTRTHVGPSYVRMITLLPGKAAGNLAAASLYTWSQSVVTDFSGPAPVVAKGPKLPDKVVDRLKMPVIVDFRNMPLQEAFAYIADEIKTPISINGDGLKLAGMTQNMAQSYDLGEVSALKAIDTMLSKEDYKGALVIVVDEKAKSIQLTSRAAAEAEGLTIFDTKQ